MIKIADIIRQKEGQIAEEKVVVSAQQMQEMASDYHRIPLDVGASLKKDRLALIAPLARSSPVEKATRHDFDAQKQAREFDRLGCDALMTSTEKTFYLGQLQDMGKIREHVHIPILLHDFIVDSYQIYQALTLGVDGIVLMPSVLDLDMLIRYLGIAHDCGLTCLVEARNAKEMGIALQSGARILMIQNEDLEGSCSLENTDKIIGMVPEDRIVVSCGCIRSLSDLETVCFWGADAAVPGFGALTAQNTKAFVHGLQGFGAPKRRKAVSSQQSKKGNGLDFPSLEDLP